jgi:hypothetical protein
VNASGAVQFFRGGDFGLFGFGQRFSIPHRQISGVIAAYPYFA